MDLLFTTIIGRDRVCLACRIGAEAGRGPLRTAAPHCVVAQCTGTTFNTARAAVAIGRIVA
jgi:hypothetical protein